MLKRRQSPAPEGPDEVECDGPTCSVRKPKRQMTSINGAALVCGTKCHNLWVRKYELGHKL